MSWLTVSYSALGLFLPSYVTKHITNIMLIFSISHWPRASPPFCTYNIFSIPIFISIFLHTQIRWAEKSWLVFGLFSLNSGSSLLTCYFSEGNSCVSLFSLSADIQKISCFALVSNQTLFTGEQGRAHFTCFGNSLLQPRPDWKSWTR